ncbi:Zinc finger, C2H2 type family protein [Brugia malayi]|uniref:Bm8116 n=2 Tax=Brugia malayi TaxID=6279 RepID=A0A1U7F3N4_BRUMA|nr:Zinc finger, C2H2 type family protein [Brugia malayi]CRZ22058.1 Bm8116 [Brugia malayi]VIO88321.1 Zinc finger, C2H2 type family protein [Brugia malayi]
MSRSVDDLGLQQPSIPTGGSDGVDGLIDIYNNSTVEVKNLLANECNVLFECRCCGNIFRSSLNYLTHKRVYCRTLRSTVASAFSAVALDFAEKALAELRDGDQSRKEGASPQHQNKGEAGTSSSTKTDSQPPKRAKGILKRTNLINVVNKRIKHYALSLPNSEHKLELHTLPRISRDVATTTFVEGQQIMESIPHALVTVDTVPADRVAVVIPQDNSSRYREMNLRNRKGDSAKNGVARKVGTEELKILERMGKYQAMMVDLSLLTCSHSDCKEKQPFSSLFTFAYHLTVKHNRRATSNKRIPCYLCDFESQTYTALIDHLKSAHEHYYQEHVTARLTSEELKRGRKGKQAKIVLMRGRSLSPLSDDFLETEESSDGSEEIGYDSAPVLELMANMEAENIELAVKDRVDYIIAVVCGDVEKAPLLEDSKYELNAQDLSNESSSRLQVRSKGRPRLGHGKAGQLGKVSPSISKKKKHGPPVWLRTARKRMENVPMDEVAGPSRISQESDEEGKHETDPPKKRGRGRKPKPRAGQTSKNDIEKDELSGNSDEAEDGRKQRPSRQRRKPNWIDENYVTGFKNKRSRRDDDDIDSEYAQPKNQSRPSSRAGQSRSPSGTQPKCVKSANSRRSTPTEPSSAIPGIQSEASSEETSNSSTPAPNENAYSVASNSHELNDGAVQSPLPLSSTGAECAKDIMTKKTCRLQYTPRARRMKYGDDLLSNVDEEEMASTSKDIRGQTTRDSTNVTSGDGRPASQSRRKQDLSTIRENNDEVMIVRYSNGEASLPKDLSEIPVYLTETQRDLFFSFIRPASPSSDGASSAHKCMQCGDIIANISEGRRHAVSHLRIMRLRCSLCGCGSFFCSDMRTHLQYRHCDKLHLAPRGYVLPGNVLPCMTQRQADDLTRVVDAMKPGRVMYTSGKIISSTNPKPYYPDPIIEERVLGTLLPEIDASNDHRRNISANIIGGVNTSAGKS